MSDYRFSVNSHDGTIYRGRLYRLDESMTSDQWGWYWESDMMVAFYDEGHRGTRVVDYTSDDSDRARLAYGYAKAYETDPYAALKRLAVRLTGEPESDFIVVHLDRGTDLYALSWDGDPDRTWRDEIEAVWNGDTWRIEIEEYIPGAWFGGDWTPAEDYADEWHGENGARAAFEKEWEHAEFPAELLVGATD